MPTTYAHALRNIVQRMVQTAKQMKVQRLVSYDSCFQALEVVDWRLNTTVLAVPCKIPR